MLMTRLELRANLVMRERPKGSDTKLGFPINQL
jgi:hypothetical protein